MDAIPLTSPDRPASLLGKTLDTTAGSALHAIAQWLEGLGFGAFTLVSLYAGAIVLTLPPLMLGAWLSSPSMTTPAGTFSMPFFYDVSTIYMYLVLFPCFLILTVSDHQLLRRSLNRIQADGILTIPTASEAILATRWNRRFLKANLTAQALGMVAGAVAVYFVYKSNEPKGTINGWDSGNPLPIAGYIHGFYDVLFAIVATVYLVRSFVVPFLLSDIIAHAALHMLPLHPDNAGGLQPIGRLGLRHQYAIALAGLNIGLGWLVSHFFTPNDAWTPFIIVGFVAYAVFGPFVFIGPLLPFRAAMMRSKAQLMSGVALRMRAQLDDLNSRIASGAITADDEQLIERLRKIGAVINDLPVWPFDALTLRTFLAAYVAPAISFVVPLLAKALYGYFTKQHASPEELRHLIHFFQVATL